MADDGIWKRGGGSYSNSGRRGGRGGRSRGRGRPPRRGGGHPLSRLEDDDGDSYMDEQETRGRSRYQPYQKKNMDSSSDGRSSVFSRLGGMSDNKRPPRGGGGGMRPGGARDGGSWHKVTVLKGASQSREWLIRSLKDAISEPFMAVDIHQLGDKILFFVEESRAAQELKNLGQLSSKGGPLTISVRPSPPPKSRGRHDRGGHDRGGRDSSRGLSSRGLSSRGGPRFAYQGQGRRLGEADGDILMDEDPTQVLTQVLGERYNTETKALDLTDMFHDQKFHQHKIRASMFDQKFVESILSIVGQHCPDLVALKLSSNRIQRLEVYSKLPVECKCLKVLDLSDNEIRSVQELGNLEGMTSITELMLRNNPCEGNVKDLASYSSSLRKYFPNLEILDGQSLPSPVKFDLPVAVGKLPPYVENYLPEEIKTPIIRFLTEFYMLYDGDSREKLLSAYSDEAVFSMSVLVPENQRDHELQVYFSKSRNLQRLKDPNKRSLLLKHGRIDIVQFIRDLPKTTHHNQLFQVDVMTSSGSQHAFVVHGVFSEVGSRKDVLVRSFTRTFVIADTGNGVVILNDLLSITCASPKTAQFVQEQLQVPQMTSLPAAVSSTSMQEVAIRKLAEATKMNLEFCSRCLSENNWDYSVALNVFTSLQAGNKIPPEAFQ